MARINENYKKLQAGYLFPEIARRTREFADKNPKVQLVRLGIGDTTLPLGGSVIKTLHETIDKMSDSKTYRGYGAEQGDEELRRAIVSHYKKYGVNLHSDEVFVSDGAKPDSANIQSIFTSNAIIAVQDPVYPVYVDSAVIGGKTHGYNGGRYDGIVYMDCLESNDFFPRSAKD